MGNIKYRVSIPTINFSVTVDFDNRYEMAIDLSKKNPDEYTILQMSSKRSNYEEWETHATYKNGKKIK